MTGEGRNAANMNGREMAHRKWLGGLVARRFKWLMFVLLSSAAVLRGGALVSQRKTLPSFRFAQRDVFQMIFMIGIIFMNSIILMSGIICRRWGRGRKGREDSTVGKASGRGQLTKADRERSYMQGVGTQRR